MDNSTSPSLLKEEYQKLKDYPELFDTFKKIMDEISIMKNRQKFKLGKLNKAHIKSFLLDIIIVKDGKGSYKLTNKGVEFSKFYLEERINKHREI